MLKSLVVVVASFNNAAWYRQNLDTILSQDYPLFHVVYVDDDSTDGTADLVAEYLRKSDRAHRVTLQRNEERLGPVANIDRVVRACDPGSIVILVDGDDFLAHDQVLSRINTIYQDPDVWVTWGQFLRFPHGTTGFCTPIPTEIVSANAFRDYPFVASHLRTFYAGLYQRIRLVDVKDSNGNFFRIAGDCAQMFALQEMAGPHGRFVAEPLYLYNRENPLSDDKVDRARQVRTEMEIRSKARYGRVARLHGTSPPREFCVASGVGRSFFEGTGPFPDSDQRRRPFRQLRSVLNRLGYTVRETHRFADLEDPHTIVVFDVRPDDLDRLTAYPRETLNLVLWKDPVSAPDNFDRRYHERFERIYTWCNDLVDNVRYFKLFLPFLRPMIDDVVPFENRRLCTLIASNRKSDHPDELYSEERKVAQYFTTKEDSFDLFGLGWNRVAYRSYRGVVPRRVEYLRRYRFSFCYETVEGCNGFVTGKIFDSFAAGCVPIYWGAPDVSASIPADCFIAGADFNSYADLHEFLQDMSAGVFEGYLERISAFLSSAAAVPYSAEHFVRTWVELVTRRATPSFCPPGRVHGLRATRGAAVDAVRMT